MRKTLLAAVLVLAAVVPLAVSGAPTHSYAQTGTVTGDEFNNSAFAAPFTVHCGANAFPQPCPDAQSATTWSLNSVSPGNLRIDTQPGTLAGASNNARNFVVQPYNPYTDFSVTTKMTFPAVPPNFTPLGQTAGLIAYLNDDNFIWVARSYTGATTGSQLQFGIEVNGVDTVAPAVTEGGFVPATIYLQLTKAANLYTASYSYDNVTFTPFFATSPTATPTSTVGTGTATPTAAPTSTPTVQGFAADYTGGQPQVGVFAWGGTNAAVAQNIAPADFDWFRVGNPSTPAATAQPTATGTPATTATPTNTVGPTATLTPTATATNTPAPAATATNTPVPTPTPRPRPSAPRPPTFKSVSLWYHTVRVKTFNHLDIQGNPKAKLGIWAGVYFPNGKHYNWYEETDSSGHWTKEFPIPADAISKYSRVAVITLQLWHGKSTNYHNLIFTVVH